MKPPLPHSHRSRRLDQWSYLKRRRNPTGVLGRPRSPVPAAVRARLARAKHKAGLRAQGMKRVSLWLPAATLEWLRAEARSSRRTLRAVVAERLAPPVNAATSPA